ncbi:MAG: hypothetical protein ACXAC7_19410, partial [Candidatus Hodarchaeales archaeon]
MSSSSSRRSGTLSVTMSAFFFGFSSSNILSMIFGIQGSSDFGFETLFDNMTIEGVSSLDVFWIILLSWAIGGIVAGVRSKNPTVGAVGSFFAAFIGALIAIIFFLTTDISALLTDPNTPFDTDKL